MKKNLEDFFKDETEQGYNAAVDSMLSNSSSDIGIYSSVKNAAGRLYSGYKPYMNSQIRNFMPIFNDLKGNFFTSVRSFIKDTYDISDADLDKFQDAINWSSTSIIATIDKSLPITIPATRIRSRIKSANLENNPDNVNDIYAEEYLKELKALSQVYELLDIKNIMESGKRTMVNSNQEDKDLPLSFGIAPSDYELSQFLTQTFLRIARKFMDKMPKIRRDRPKLAKSLVEETYKDTIGKFGVGRYQLKDGDSEQFKSSFHQILSSDEVDINAIDILAEDISNELLLKMKDMISWGSGLNWTYGSGETAEIADLGTEVSLNTVYYYNRAYNKQLEEVSPTSFYLTELKKRSTGNADAIKYLTKLNEAFYTLLLVPEKFNYNGPNPDTEFIKLFPDNLLKSKANGDTSAIFTFMDYRDAYAEILNHTTNSNYTKIFTGTGVMVKQLRPVRDDQNVKRIFFNSDKMNTTWNHRVNKDKILKFKGFFHTACLTGVVFPLDGQNTEFNYQSRMIYHGKPSKYTEGEGGKMTDYMDYDGGNKGPRDREVYDYTFDLPKRYSKMKLFNLAALKRPTSYLIPSCRGCGCLKYRDGSDTGGNITGNYLKTVLATAKVLDFSQGYEWKEKKTSPRKAAEKYVEKSFTPEQLGVEGDISGDYCLYTPILPQSHNLGSGTSKETEAGGSGEEAEIICPVADATDGIESLDLTMDEINDIINTCQNVMDSFPMSEDDCQNAKLNNKCLLLDKDGFAAAGISGDGIPIKDVLTGEWSGSSDCLAPATQKPPTKMCNPKVLLSR
jgi:hypothetical protein